MTKFKILIIALILPLFAFTLHKYYLSLVKIEYKTENKSVQITMRIFIDDLQETINKIYEANIELAVSNEVKEVNTLILKYVKDNFEVKINTISQPYQFIGKEYENDVVFLYLEITNVENLESIEIKDSMLMDIYPDQKNIIKLQINEIKKTFLLTAKKDKDLLKLN